MLTPSSTFAAHSNKTGAILNIVLSLTDGTDTWRFSKFPINKLEASGTIEPPYPMLSNMSTISESLDPLTRRWATSDVTITLSNIPFLREDGDSTMLRASDILGDVVGYEASVYLLPMVDPDGSFVLSDLLLRFRGVVESNLEYTDKDLTVRLKGGGTLPKKYLPNWTGADVNANIAIAGGNHRVDEDTVIPLLYGRFTQSYWTNNSYSGTGLAKAYRMYHAGAGSMGLRYAVGQMISETYADSATGFYHYVNSISAVWWAIHKEIMVTTTRFYMTDFHTLESTHIIIPADTGSSTIHSVETGYPNRVQVYTVTPANTDIPSQADEGYSWLESEGFLIATYPERAFDGDTSTYAILYDNAYDAGNLCYGIAAFGFDRSDHIRDYMQSGNEAYVRVMGYNINEGDWSPVSCTINLYSGGADVGGYLPFTPSTGWNNISMYPTVIESATAIYDMWFSISCSIIGTGGPNGVVGDLALLNIPELQVGVTVIPDEYPDQVWAECDGIAFGSWIDAGGRSNDYNSGDVIEDPAFILEHLLRGEMDVDSDDMDLDSFDDAANPNMTMNLSVDRKTSSSTIIKQICEQSSFALIVTATNIVKLIDYGHTRSTVATIPYAHIENGSLHVSKTDYIVNHLTVESSYLPEFGGYKSSFTEESSTSQTRYGYKKATVKWPNLHGSSASHIAQLHVSSPNNLWSNAHVIVKFNTLGFVYSDLEIGDMIELDYESIDSHFKCYGESWQTRQLMITGLNHTMTSVEITAMELTLGVPGSMIATAKASAIPPQVIAINPIVTVNLASSPATVKAWAGGASGVGEDGPLIINMAARPATVAASALCDGMSAVITVDLSSTPAIAVAGARPPAVVAYVQVLYDLPVIDGAWYHYKFDEDLTDESDNNYTLTGTGIDAADYEIGYTHPTDKSCLNMNRSPDSGEYLASTALDIPIPVGQHFSVEMIIKCPDNEPSYIIFKNVSSENGWGVFTDGGSIIFQVRYNGLLQTATSDWSGLADGEWHYIVIAMYTSATLWRATFYVDGAYDSMKWMHIDITGTVGAEGAFMVLPTGYIDELAMVGHEMSSTEILERSLGRPDTGDYAVSFNGSTGVGATPGHEDLACNSALTIEFWIKTTETTEMDIIGQWYGQSNTWNWVVGMYSTGNIYLQSMYDTEQIISTAINDGDWHHVVAIMDGTYWKGYLDNAAFTPVSRSTLPSNMTTMVVAGAGTDFSGVTTSPFTGTLEETRIYNVALTSTQVSTHWNDGNGTHNALSDGLVAQWHFNEGAGGVAGDARSGRFNMNVSCSWVTGKINPPDTIDWGGNPPLQKYF